MYYSALRIKFTGMSRPSEYKFFATLELGKKHPQQNKNVLWG